MLRDRSLVAVLLIALALRLATVLWLSDTVPYSDGRYYHLAAEKMAADWKFAFDRSQVEYYGKLGWWPPLYPAFLSLVYRIFGVSFRAAIFVQVLLGTVAVGLVHAIARRAAGPRVATVAALLIAVDPTYIFLANILASENLYIVWLALGLWLAGRAWPDKFSAPGGRVGAMLHEYRGLLLAGFVFGLGTLTRAIGTLVPLIVSLAARSRVRSRRAWLVGGACLVGASALTVAPWTLRNYLVTGAPALVCFGGGLNFYFGHNDQTVGYRDLSQTPMAQLTTQAAIDRAGYRAGFECLARNPFGFVTRGVKKVVMLFGSPGYAPHSSSAIMLPEGWQTDPAQARIAEELRARQRAKNAYLDGVFTLLGRMHSWLLLLGALVACAAWRRLPIDLRTGAWLCVYWIASHVVFWGQPRFRYPMDIPMALLTAFALVEVRRGGRGREAVRRSVRAAVAVFALATLAAFAGTGCTPAKQSYPMPSVEPWGDLARPYDDPIEVAAVNALGPQPLVYAFKGSTEPIRLADFLMLGGSERSARGGLALSLVEEAQTRRRMGGRDSLAAYTEAIRIDPTCVPAYEEAARIVCARGAMGRAQALAVQGLRLDSGSKSLWGTLANVYLARGDDRRARQVLEHVLRLDPSGAGGIWESLAALYLRTGQPTRADSLLQQAPKEVAAKLAPYVAGLRARDSGDWETARNQFAVAAADSQPAVAVLVDLGNAEYAGGRLGPAEEAYRRALRYDPESAPAWNGLGIVQRARGDLDGASRSFTHIVARKPDDAAAQFNLAATSHQAALRAGKTPRADSLYALSEGAFAACMGLGFRAEESRLRHAEVRLERGAPADAYREASAMMSDPKYGASARFLAGRAAMAAGRPQDVVAVLAPVFQSDKLSDDGLDLLGSAYSKLGRPADAARVLRRAHERRPDDWQTAMNLGVALSQSGDLAGAEKVLRPLAEAHPNEPAVLQNLAAVLQRRGRRTEADKLLRRAETLR